MRKIIFLDRYLSLKFFGKAAYLMAVALIIICANNDYKNFIEKKKIIIESLTYKIAFDLANIFDDTENVLNDINKKIAQSGGSKDEIGKILAEESLVYKDNFIKSQLSTGNFYWIDKKNNLIATSEGMIGNAIDLSDRDYLQKTSKTFGRIYVGEPIVGASSGQYAIPLGVGIIDKSGNYIGTIVASFRMSELLTRYSQMVDPLGANFVILDLKNNVFLASDINFFKQDSKLSQELSSFEMKASEQAISNFELFDRSSSYAVLRSFEKYPYKILVGYKNGEIKSQLMMELLVWLVQFLFLTMFFSLAMLGLRRR